MRVVFGRSPLGQLQNLPQELKVILSNTQLAHDGDLSLPTTTIIRSILQTEQRSQMASE